MNTTLIAIGIIVIVAVQIFNRMKASAANAEIVKEIHTLKNQLVDLANHKYDEFNQDVTKLLEIFESHRTATGKTLQTLIGNLQDHCTDVNHRLNGIINNLNNINDILALYQEVLGEQKVMMEANKEEAEREMEELRRQVRDYITIKERMANGESMSSIAKSYGVKTSLISRLVHFGDEHNWTDRADAILKTETTEEPRTQR